MNKFFKKTIWLVFISLIIANVWVFMNGVNLANEVNFYEKQVKQLRSENIDLEKQVYKFDSITYAASIAAELSFDSNSAPMYLTGPEYALNR